MCYHVSKDYLHVFWVWIRHSISKILRCQWFIKGHDNSDYDGHDDEEKEDDDAKALNNDNGANDDYVNCGDENDETNYYHNDNNLMMIMSLIMRKRMTMTMMKKTKKYKRRMYFQNVMSISSQILLYSVFIPHLLCILCKILKQVEHMCWPRSRINQCPWEI